jgi:hypothetical protein
MSTVMVRITMETRERLRKIAEREGTSLQSVVDRAVEEHERQVFWSEMDTAWATLKNDPVAWQAELDERTAWDSTAMDGVDPAEAWDLDGSTYARGGSIG